MTIYDRHNVDKIKLLKENENLMNMTRISVDVTSNDIFCDLDHHALWSKASPYPISLGEIPLTAPSH
jgi:hypothetical protein